LRGRYCNGLTFRVKNKRQPFGFFYFGFWFRLGQAARR